ncbi:hypothetical protein EVA_13914, partial [gut metagenome]
MTGAAKIIAAEKGIPVLNPEQSRYCKWSLSNYVTAARWEGAVGREAKPGDLPVTKR